LIAVAAVAGAGCPETLEVVGQRVDDLQSVRDTRNQIKTLRVSGKAISKATVAVVANAGAIAPTSEWLALSAAGAVTCTVQVATFKGQKLNIVNTGTPTITIADSGNVNLSAAAVLGKDDNLLLYSYSGTNWVEIGRTDN